MAKRSETSVMEPLGESEFGELDELLLSDDVPEACMDVVTLEGFLTAIAIGPVTVTPEHWLPRVFGSEAEDPMPELPSVKVFKHVVNLIMRLYNSVIMIFEIAPEEFNPTFYTHEVEGKSYTIVDEWCSGFLQGIALADDAWQPLLDEKPGILRPFATLCHAGRLGRTGCGGGRGGDACGVVQQDCTDDPRHPCLLVALSRRLCKKRGFAPSQERCR